MISRKVANGPIGPRSQVENHWLKCLRIRVSRRDPNIRANRKASCGNLDDRYLTEDVKKFVLANVNKLALEIVCNRQNSRINCLDKKESSCHSPLSSTVSLFSNGNGFDGRRVEWQRWHLLLRYTNCSLRLTSNAASNY